MVSVEQWPALSHLLSTVSSFRCRLCFQLFSFHSESIQLSQVLSDVWDFLKAQPQEGHSSSQGFWSKRRTIPGTMIFFFFSDCRPGLVSLCKGSVPLDSVKAWTQKWVNPWATINKLHYFKGRKQPTHSILHWSLGNRAQHFSKYQLLGWRIFQKESLTWWKWVRPTRAWPFACPVLISRSSLSHEEGVKKTTNPTKPFFQRRKPNYLIPFISGKGKQDSGSTSKEN